MSFGPYLSFFILRSARLLCCNLLSPLDYTSLSSYFLFRMSQDRLTYSWDLTSKVILFCCFANVFYCFVCVTCAWDRTS